MKRLNNFTNSFKREFVVLIKEAYKNWQLGAGYNSSHSPRTQEISRSDSMMIKYQVQNNSASVHTDLGHLLSRNILIRCDEAIICYLEDDGSLTEFKHLQTKEELCKYKESL